MSCIWNELLACKAVSVSHLSFCSAAYRYQGGPGAVPVLHLQYRGIEHLQNLKVRVPPALGRPSCATEQSMQQQQVNGASHAQDFTSVTTLLAAGNRIRQIEGLHALTSLLHLDLAYNQLSAVGDLRSLPRLEVLVSLAQTVPF